MKYKPNASEKRRMKADAENGKRLDTARDEIARRVEKSSVYESPARLDAKVKIWLTPEVVKINNLNAQNERLERKHKRQTEARARQDARIKAERLRIEKRKYHQPTLKITNGDTTQK